MTVDATPGFAGWHRSGKGRAWARVCEGGTYQACWSALIATATRGGDLLVLPAGRSPDSPPPGASFARHERGRGLSEHTLGEGQGA